MEPVHISSRKNPALRAAAELKSSAEARKSAGAFIAEGARLVEDAAKSGMRISSLFYTAEAYEKYRLYIDAALRVCREAYTLEPHAAALLATTKSSQGVYAVCEIPRGEKEIQGKIIVLENIQDPSNMGTMLRTAEAMGIGCAVLSGCCCDVYSPKVLRGSMGAVFRLNLKHFGEPAQACRSLREMGYKVYGSVPLESALKINEVSFDEHSAVVIGNEGNGMTEASKKLCHGLITIPMKGRAESLNAATAAALVMWEMTK